jgi:hypothetical protein
VTSASRAIGRLGYFDEEGVGRGEGMTKERGAVGGLRPYASAKLMMVGFGVELRRRLVEVRQTHPSPTTYH